MATNQQLRIMYGRIGFNNGSNNINVDVQGIDSVRELGYLYNNDATELCKTIRRPGGHLPKPTFVAGAVPLLPATIPYVGIMVSHRAETNTELAPYSVRHHYRISWVTNVGAMNPTSSRR